MKINIDLQKLIDYGIDANNYIILDCLYHNNIDFLKKYLTLKKPTENEFYYLLEKGFITLINSENKFVSDNIIINNKFVECFYKDKVNNEFEKCFEELLNTYPKVVTDGYKKRRLQSEKNNCKKLYQKIILSNLNNEIDLELHNKIIEAIKKEIEEKQKDNSTIYMVELIRYLRNQRYDAYLDVEEESKTTRFKTLL